MMYDERVIAVTRLIFEYVKSPSLRHIRDPNSIGKLAREIVRRLDHANSIWQKWDGQREVVVAAAAGCWLPIGDLKDFLQGMPGPALTLTDVEQRLRAIQEANHTWPDEDVKPGCLALYEKERAEGTELPAIIGAMQEYAEKEQERIRAEQQAEWRQRVREKKDALEQRFLSGADCKWTPVLKSAELFCRINARIYRLSQTKDKMLLLHRVAGVEDDGGTLIGKYLRRADVTKALGQVAYQPEPKW